MLKATKILWLCMTFNRNNTHRDEMTNLFDFKHQYLLLEQDLFYKMDPLIFFVLLSSFFGLLAEEQSHKGTKDVTALLYIQFCTCTDYIKHLYVYLHVIDSIALAKGGKRK